MENGNNLSAINEPPLSSLGRNLNTALEGKDSTKIPSNIIDLLENVAKGSESDDIKKYFSEYFPDSRNTLEGQRGIQWGAARAQPKKISKLLIADLVWLFYFERMGIFKILGAILDDFAIKGKYPIPNNDDTARILEKMIYQIKSGDSSTARDRVSAYRRCLGWTTETGRKMGLETATNSAFNDLFHKFIQNTLGYYKDKRLADLIKGKNVASTSGSGITLVTIGNTIRLLKQSFRPFNHGRNYSITLSGIAWCIAALYLLKQTRGSIGLSQYNDIEDYMPTAYNLLVVGQTKTNISTEANRYMLHRDCAGRGRDLLLDIDAITDKDINSSLEIWLANVEDQIEGYRTAYHTLTGVDLGSSGLFTIPQKA